MDSAFNAPAPTWLVRIIGGVLGSFGIGMLARSGTLILQLQLRGHIEAVVVVFLAILVPLTWFCLSVGGRLAFSKPNASGSILTPFGWLVLAAIFAVISVGGAVLAVQTREAEPVYLLIYAISFAVWCWKRRVQLLTT